MSANKEMSNGFSKFIQNLRAALPYLEKFYNETFIIKLSGYTLQQENLPTILDDLILLRRVGIKIILIHGAAPQVNDQILENGKKGGYTNNQLYIDDTTFPIAQRAIAAANWDLVTKLSNYGSDFLPLTGHFIQAQRKSSPNSVSSRYIGDVTDVNIRALEQSTAQHYIPVITPLGIGSRGKLFILDPNRIALEVSARMRASKCIILTSENGDLEKELGNKKQATTKDMHEWLQTHPDMNYFTRKQLSALTEACERGVERCHLLDSSVDGILLGEILTSAGIGIMITNSSYQQIRSAKFADIHSITEILEKPIKESVVVNKSIHYLEQHIENFIVFCVDEEVVGCCELIPYDDSRAVEVASLAVKEAHRNRGIGKSLIEAAIGQAKKENNKVLFSLTTKVGYLFTGLGFKKMSPNQLPIKKRKNYDFHDSLIYGIALLD